MTATILSFIVSMSVFLSINWSGSPGPLFNSWTLLLGLLVAVIASLILWFALWARPSAARRLAPLRLCPHCGRQVPFEATTCSSCGHPLP